MIIKCAEHPGSHERHLLRKAANPLFENAVILDDDALLDAQRSDQGALAAFQAEFQQLLEATIALKGTVESDVVLQLKDRLDRAYETASHLAGEQSAVKEAIRKLLRFIMGAVREGAGNDAQAHHELDQEEMAREAHFSLLGSRVVADLLNPASPIQPDELIPTLLSSSKDELQLALQLFDEVQLLAILTDGAKRLEHLQDNGIHVEEAWQTLAFMQGYAEFASALGNDEKVQLG